MLNIDYIIDTSSIDAVKAKVELYNGSTLVKTCTCSDYLQDFTVNRVGENNKFFGFGVCQGIKLTLIDMEREINLVKGNIVKVAFGNGTNFVYPYPTFYVEEVTRDEETNAISIDAYDKLYKASAHKISEIDFASMTSKNVWDYANAGYKILNPSKVAIIGNSSVSLRDYSINMDGAETLRDYFDDIAEVLGTIYYLTNQDLLIFKGLDKSAGGILRTITRDEYFSLKTGDAITLDAICHATELGDNVSTNVAGTEGGTTQYVRDNMFWSNEIGSGNIASVLEETMASLNGLSINQFTCEDWIGDFSLEIGDKIALTTEDGSTIISYVLNDSITYDGTFSESTLWTYEANETETPTNPTSLGEKLNQTFAKVDKANKEIQLLISDVSANKSNIAEIKLDLDGINLTLKEQGEAIENIETPDVSGLENTVSTHTEKISGIEIDLDSVKTSVSNQETKISTLESDTGELKGTTESHTSQIASLEVNTKSINASISEVEKNTKKSLTGLSDELSELTKTVSATITKDEIAIEIESALSNGVDRVETSTGFTFDSDGLNISKSDSEMTTQISEDGMIISRSGQETLVADNTGVKAENLHATTYLIIGNNSRLEDYGSNRTGCFWIGG